MHCSSRIMYLTVHVSFCRIELIPSSHTLKLTGILFGEQHHVWIGLQVAE